MSLPDRDRLRRAQDGARWLAVVCGLLGLVAAGGCRPEPPDSVALLWPLHPAMLVLGVVAGRLAAARFRSIEQNRWQVLEDPHLSGGEREYAHRHAEQERRWAGTWLLAAPVLVGYWLASQLHAENGFRHTDLLLLPPMLGFALALLLRRDTDDPVPPEMQLRDKD